MWNDYGFHNGWGGMGFGMILFWVLVLVVVVVLLGKRNRVRPSAREVLDERYARGEIDREEYEKKRAALENDLGAPASRGRADTGRAAAHRPPLNVRVPDDPVRQTPRRV